jgi:hypothetical protein
MSPALQEFRFMRKLKAKDQLSALSGDNGLDPGGDFEGEGQLYFQRYTEGSTPFDGQQEEEEKEDVFSGGGVSGTDLFCFHKGRWV